MDRQDPPGPPAAVLQLRYLAGGQNKRIGSELTAFETCADFTYAVGDATPVYSEKKCRQMVRQFVFLPPDHFVVFDRVAATESEYAKTWLLHYANEPTIERNAWRSDQNRGRIFCRTLLPEDAAIEKVGGPGREFLVEGVNYGLTAGPSKAIVKLGHNPRKLDWKGVPELVGRWRVEVKPGASRAEDVFLHFIEVGDITRERMADRSLTQSTGQVELSFVSAEDRRITVTFATDGEVAGHLRIDRGTEAVIDRPFTQEVMARSSL